MASGHSFQTGSRRREFRVMSAEQIMVFFPFLENFHFWERFSKKLNVFFFKNGKLFKKMGTQNHISNFN